MYRAILLILYLVIFIVSFTQLIRYRESPLGRRLSAALGAAGMFVAPPCACYLCELISSLLSIALLLLIIFGGLGLMIKSLFH